MLKHSGYPSSSMFGLIFELDTDPMEGISCGNRQCLISVGVNEMSSAVLAVDE